MGKFTDNDREYYSDKGRALGKIQSLVSDLNYALARTEHAKHISMEEYSELSGLISIIRQIIRAKQTGVKVRKWKITLI